MGLFSLDALSIGFSSASAMMALAHTVFFLKSCLSNPEAKSLSLRMAFFCFTVMTMWILITVYRMNPFFHYSPDFFGWIKSFGIMISFLFLISSQILYCYYMKGVKNADT